MQILLHSIWTLVVFALFVGIVIWAYSGKRKRGFDEAARLALDEDSHPQTQRDSASKEQKHG